MEYQASSATLSKKLSNGHIVSSKSVYDGVFSAPSSKFGAPNFPSRVLDYSDIFAGSEASRGSSIPFIDVPALNGSNVSADFRSSKLDYSKVFGGFGELEFAVSFEELISEPKNRNDFSEKARCPAERGSPSEGADPSDCQEKNQMFSHETSYQSFDDVKKFSASYNKINQVGENGTNGTTHVAQLHAVHGYTCLIDEMTTLQMTDSKKSVPSSVNDAYLKKDFSDRLTGSVHSTKVVTDFPAGGASKQKCEDGVALQNKSDMCGSNSIDMLFGAYEYGHGHSLKVSPSSSPLPNLCGSKGDSERSMAPKFGASGIHFEGAGHVSSPPYSDEEVDANSFAAASVAALRKAIEEAQEKMKIARESLARKKEGLQNCVNLSSNYGLKAELRRKGKATDKAKRYKEKKDSEIYEKEDAPVQVSASMRKQSLMRAGHSTDFGVRESPLGTKAAFGEQFFELVTTGKHKAIMLEFEKADNTKEEGFQKPEECSERSNAVEEAHKQEIERKINAVKAAVKSAEPGGELKSAQQVHDQKENEKRLRVVQEQEESEKKVKASHVQEICEEKLRNLEEAINYEENIEIREFEENENMKGQMEPQEWVENEKQGKEAFEEEYIQKEQEGAHLGEDTEKRLDKVHEKAVIETRFNDLYNGKSLEVNGDLEGNEKLQEAGENEKLLKGVVYRIEEKENTQKETCEWIGAEKIQTDIDQSAEDEKRLEVAQEALNYKENNLEAAEDQCKQDEGEDLSENQKASRHVENDKDVEVTLEVQVPTNDENGSRIEVNTASVKQEENLKESEDVKDENDIRATEEALYDEDNLETADDGCTQEGSEKLSKNHEASRQKENDKDVQVTLELPAHEENGSRIEVNKASVTLEESVKESEGVKHEIDEKTTEEALYDDNFETADDGCKQNGSEKLSNNHEASRQKQNDKEVEVTLEVPAHEENISTMEVNTASFEHRENGKELEAVKEANDMEDKEILETVGFSQNAFRSAEMKQQMEDVIETVVFDSEGVNFVKTDMSSGQKKNDQHAEEHKIVFNLGRNIEELAPERGEIYMNVKEVEVAADQEEGGNNSTSPHKEKWVYGNKVKAAQLPSMFEGEGDSLETALKITQITEKNETHQSGLTMEEKESNATEQKDDESEKEHFKNIDEGKEREREREREREKMVVERAIREARERAFAEARERAEKAAAERAAAEAHRRVMAEAREKLEKTSAANEKSSAEKATIETKLKAERAAVERATAEARERALERAMSEKAAFEARNRAEKFVGEKFSGASRDNGRRQSFSSHDPHHKGLCSTSNSSHGGMSYFPHSTERFDGGHQRVAERAAKALAEKNMRDLLAQKEQAERNRLAESLDADVKRWSSGKEGNLRALLSTLQYILGPDSSWQPIPLTDIIKTSAVKKAYRKATLYVHPDKLQQRGASIQQKYTCEKVFDLLKEAWNKFNVGER